MRLVLAAVFSLVALTAQAQTAIPPAPRAYDLAPWWMDKPIIASTGYVTSEVQANRANLSATYMAVDRDVATATKLAAQKARTLSAALSAYPTDKVRVEMSFAITPLYEQYKDKEGQRLENERADKIERYQASVNVSLEIRDVRLAEIVYAVLVAGKPANIQAVSFGLEPDNETKTQMFKLAVEDARRRADLGAQAAGAHVTTVRLIDPTGRACETDVLVMGAQRTYSPSSPYAVAAPPGLARSSVEELIVTGARKAAEVGLRPEDLQLPVQPPLQRLEAKACVVFGLS